MQEHVRVNLGIRVSALCPYGDNQSCRSSPQVAAALCLASFRPPLASSRTGVRRAKRVGHLGFGWMDGGMGREKAVQLGDFQVGEITPVAAPRVDALYPNERTRRPSIQIRVLRRGVASSVWQPKTRAGKACPCLGHVLRTRGTENISPAANRPASAARSRCWWETRPCIQAPLLCASDVLTGEEANDIWPALAAAKMPTSSQARGLYAVSHSHLPTTWSSTASRSGSAGRLSRPVLGEIGGLGRRRSAKIRPSAEAVPRTGAAASAAVLLVGFA